MSFEFSCIENTLFFAFFVVDLFISYFEFFLLFVYNGRSFLCFWIVGITSLQSIQEFMMMMMIQYLFSGFFYS